MKTNEMVKKIEDLFERVCTYHEECKESLANSREDPDLLIKYAGDSSMSFYMRLVEYQEVVDFLAEIKEELAELNEAKYSIKYESKEELQE